MLYDFSELDRKLDQLGFPKIQGGSGFQIIKGIDFEKAFKSGSISFEDDGIYLEYEGKKYRGYMFIKEPWIDRFGTYPKFHLTKCQTIQEFIAKGRFKIRYEWSNSNINDLIDKTTKKLYKDEVLDYCGYCKKELFEGIADTEDFFDALDKSEIEEENIEVDLFGYTRDKEKISKDYRRRQNYTCKECGIKPLSNMHKRWWHTHHINGDKTNNSLNNLKCLCILCHSNVDARHRQNFSKGAMPKQIETFKKEYLNFL
jgi:hypothetical protein